MRRILRIITCICLLPLVACAVEFDFDGLDDDPVFLIDAHVKSEPYSPSMSNFQMYLYAVPSAAGDRQFSEDARCTLKVYKNSELIDTKDYITIQSFYGLIADNYPAGPGDEVMITAESAGFPTVSSSLVIPQAPPETTTACSLSEDGNLLKIICSFEDDGGTDDAYAFRFMSTSSKSRPDDNYTGGYGLDLIFDDSSGPLSSDTGPFDIRWEDGYTFYGLFDDSFNGGRKEFEVNAFMPDHAYGEILYYRVEIQRISPERLRYEIACRDKGSNILGFIGLAPVTFAYTNVSGGTGCFSGGNTGYTDWIEVPLE